MCTTKLSPTARDGIAVGVLQHAGGVDGDVALRVAEDREDVGGRCGDGALDFDAFGHGADGVRAASRPRAGLRPSVVRVYRLANAEPCRNVCRRKQLTDCCAGQLRSSTTTRKRDIGLSDIAAAVGVTPRSVQYTFRRHLGTTPLEYLRRVRLDRAHRDLQAADPVR